MTVAHQQEPIYRFGDPFPEQLLLWATSVELSCLTRWTIFAIDLEDRKEKMSGENYRRITERQQHRKMNVYRPRDWKSYYRKKCLSIAIELVFPSNRETNFKQGVLYYLATRSYLKKAKIKSYFLWKLHLTLGHLKKKCISSKFVYADNISISAPF